MNAILMKMKDILAFKNILLALTLFLWLPLAAQNKAEKILIVGATAHIGNGEVIENAALGINGDKIDLLMSAKDYRLDSSLYDKVLYYKGQHIYPAFISANNTLGLVEINAVRASRDEREVGKFNPQIRSLTSYNTDSKIIPTVRTNGVLIVQSTPQGGRISGTSSIFNLDGWNWEDAVLKQDDGIHINWPSVYESKWVNGNRIYELNKDYENELLELQNFFKNALAYSKSDFILEKNLRFEAMKAVFNGKKRVYIHANLAKELSEAIYFIKQFDLKKAVIVGGYDAALVSDLLVDYNIPVILRRVHELPVREDDDINLPYKLPFLLKEAGVTFCLQNDGSMQEMGTRNLPFYAGTAAAYGLSKEEALRSITLDAAKILGIDHEVGSLEVGKLATLFISKGDALDMKTNHLSYALIEGKNIDLNNSQKELYEKYMNKYGLKPY